MKSNGLKPCFSFCQFVFDADLVYSSDMGVFITNVVTGHQTSALHVLPQVIVIEKTDQRLGDVIQCFNVVR